MADDLEKKQAILISDDDYNVPHHLTQANLPASFDMVDEFESSKAITKTALCLGSVCMRLLCYFR